MKTVLITGSEGFVGKNLRVTLQGREDIRLLSFDVQQDPSELNGLLDQADFVFHLAGVNRPKHEDEFRSGNTSLTEQICARLLSSERKAPVLLSSSVQAQASIENPYGASKKGAEDAVFAYGRQSGAPVFVYRLPNVFGKWSRPNYNSAVATFCHHIARDLPIQINDPDVVLNLVYIDDVIRSFISALDGALSAGETFQSVSPVYSIRLGAMAERILSFKACRETKSIPDMSDAFTKKLYSAYLSYLPTDSFSYPLKMNVDDRGSFTEIIRMPDRGQVSVNISKPGITKGHHWHHTKNEKFLVVSGNGLIRFRKVGTDEILTYPVSAQKLEVVDIPVGYTHDITNTGTVDLVTIMWCNEPFNPEAPDTVFESVELNSSEQ